MENFLTKILFLDLQLLSARNQCQCIKRLQCQIQKAPYKNCKFTKMLESQSRDLGPKMIFNSYLSRSSNLRLFSLTRNFDHQNARGIFDGNSWGLAPLEFFFSFWKWTRIFSIFIIRFSTKILGLSLIELNFSSFYFSLA